MYGTFSAYINVIYNIFLLTGSQSTKDTVPLELHPQGGIFCLAPAGGSNPAEP